MNWHSKVIYQIYPKSFKDSNQDGIGDLNGITSKLAYLSKLGVDMIWLSPIYVSPQNDNGYDVADYYQIDPIFGTMSDFDTLVTTAKSYDIDIMLDMVFNHTSTEHEWFQRALAGEKHYQDFYYIRPPKPDGSLPTNWQSKFGGAAWQSFGNSGQYYLNLYDKTQADLDWHNPFVKQEIVKVVNFWLNKGVKGFRFDVINVIGKDEVLIDSASINNEKILYTDKPIVHQYLQELNRETFGKYDDVITVGEMSSTNIENCILYTQPQRHELSMTFNFHHLKVDYDNGNKWTTTDFDFIELKHLFNQWQVEMDRGDGWNALFWNNHDQPRALSRFCKNPNYYVEAAKMLAQTIHLMKGTPYIYQGEEIGMLNANFDDIKLYHDIESYNIYKTLLADGLEEKYILNILKEKSRDNSRTPMPWNQTINGGFSEVQPWLTVPEDYQTINVEKELKEGSIFKYYQQLIQLRKQFPVISEGHYQPLLTDHPTIFAYQREWQGTKLIVINNFYDQEVEIDLPNGKYQYLLGNYGQRDYKEKLTIRPYETVAFINDNSQ